MSAHSGNQQPETTTLGTVAWTGVVILLALAVVLLLSWLGPVGGR